MPDLHSALLSYEEARGRIIERKRNKGFWPLRSSSRGKSGKGFAGPSAKGLRKGQSTGNDELLNRIARTLQAVWRAGTLEGRMPTEGKRVSGKRGIGYARIQQAKPFRTGHLRTD